jgi:hypothetical protein
MNEYLLPFFSRISTFNDGIYGSSSSYMSDDSAPGVAILATLAYIFFILILTIGAYVFVSICLSKVFKKAGIKPWIAWVPFYNNWKFFEMGSFHGALSLLTLVPYAGTLAFMILYWISAYRIGLRFGKEGAFVLLSIFLSPVWLGILAFDKSKWSGAKIHSTTPTESAK